MQMLPTIVKFLTLGILSMAWLALHQRVMQLDGRIVYHLAAHQRDLRKAQFYYRSVWTGLIAAFLSLGSLEAVSQIVFDSNTTRDWALGVLRGLGIWGLFIVGMVWVRIGLRASQPNMDGDSLKPLPDEKHDKPQK